MYELVRDSAFGQIVRFATRNKYFLYSEELDAFRHPFYPARKERSVEDSSNPLPDTTSPSHLETTDVTPSANSEQTASLESNNKTEPDVERRNPSKGVNTQHSHPEVEKTTSAPIKPLRTNEGMYKVDWYTTDDPENPQNWSELKKAFVAAQICIYSFAVYFGSSIYVGAVPELVEKFGISVEVSSLGLALYVFGYGLGPMVFSPVSEIAAVGRNIPYITTLAIYTILWVPAALIDNFAGFMVLRFLTGFFGSPCLATGGATLADIYPLIKLPHLLVVWGAATVFGPALAPVIANFSAPAKDWHWVSWEMLWLSAPICLCFFFFLPETSASTILYYRARRLRKITGDDRYQSQAETEQSKLTAKDIFYDAIIKPTQINVLDPAVLFSTVYTSLVYGIFYSFFESFPMVFLDVYHFKFEVSGLPFLGVLPGLFTASILVMAYWHFSVVRRFPTEGFAAFGAPEDRLVPALYACFWLPIGLFLFAWASRPGVHWIVPIIGLALSIIGTFTIIACMMQYLAFTYPKYSASLFAANDFARSTLAAGAIMFSRPMFLDVGINWGVTLLAFLDLVCCFLLYALWAYGAKLRAKSRFAQG